jgi:hypothetical protein
VVALSKADGGGLLAALRGETASPVSGQIDDDGERRMKMTDTTNWRDKVKVHPAAEMFPMMSDVELDELAKDIAEHGLQQLPTWIKTGDGDFLLDGRNRFAAVDRIPDTAVRNELRASLLGFRDFLPEGDPYAYVVSANLHRRHLTTEQKRDVIAKLLQENPTRSDRATAKIAKVSHHTVADVRSEAEQRGQIAHVSTRADTKGRQQPARKPRPSVITRLAEEAAAAAKPERDQAIVNFAALLHRKLPQTLDDLTRLLDDERARIAELPAYKRKVIARGYLSALNITLDDLRPVSEDLAAE